MCSLTRSIVTLQIWINDNGMGVATRYNGSGAPIPLVVTIPPPAHTPGPAAPTGIVFNGAGSNFGGAPFIFDTEGGTLSSGAGGTSAVLQATLPPARSTKVLPQPAPP